MPTHPTRSMQRRLDEAKKRLDAVRSEERLARRLRAVGYGEQRLEEADALLAAVHFAMDQAASLEAEQREKQAVVRRSRAPLDRALRDGVQLARAALGDEHPWLAEAGILTRRPRGSGPAPRDQSLSGLIERATLFFRAAQTAPDAIQAALNQVGLGTMALRLGEGMIATTQRHYDSQLAHADQLAQAVEQRQIAFETLDDWMKSFKRASRVALRDYPELLALLGLNPRGRPRKRPRSDG